jgi:tetratricopeptide (TPR) repeat protein
MFNRRRFRCTLKHGVAVFSILATVALPAIGQASADANAQQSPTQLTARGELNEGVKAYKAARYEEAITHFERATELDPGLLTAKTYLATALAQNVVPGLDTPENLKTAHRAIAVFEQVLEVSPQDVNSMKQVAGILFSIKNFDDAKVWQKKVLAEDPGDSAAAYTIGVIDWAEAHQNVLIELKQAGLNDDGEGNVGAPRPVMVAIKAQNSPLVAEAIEYLVQAVENQPNYDDAMAYLNLVYRRKADLDWDDEAARRDDLAKAKEWTRKAMETRKAKEEKNRPQPDSAQP